MDYEVFLVSRIHEEWLRDRDATAAIHHGVSTTGRLITAAATIMICVFASFALGDNRDVKLFGISMASAVFLDAFVVRSLLLPSVLQLLGPRAWWMPAWLSRRAPRISIDAEIPVTHPRTGGPMTATAPPHADPDGVADRGRTPAIVVEALVQQYKKGPRAVDGINLTVSPGEIYGFLGPNGAGKSSTVLMLTTLLAPTGGQARVGGFDVVRQARQVRQAIGVALQDVALDEMLTGHEHLLFQATLHGIGRRAAASRAEELLDRVGLAEAAGRRIAGYSGGMEPRLDLALALVHRPQILFLDEPTTGLDPPSRTALWSEVQPLARDDGVTVFLTTQYLEEADALAGRIESSTAEQSSPKARPAHLEDRTEQPDRRSAAGRPEPDREFIEHARALRPTLTRPRRSCAAQPRREARGSSPNFVRALDQRRTLGRIPELAQALA